MGNGLRLHGSRGAPTVITLAIVLVTAVLAGCGSSESGDGDGVIDGIGAMLAGATTTTTDEPGATSTTEGVAWTVEPQAPGDGGGSASGPGSGSGGSPGDGSPVITQPGGTTLFTCNWGSAPGEFGLEYGDMGMYPMAMSLYVAVSPDEKTIAILDGGNGRIQFFSRAGRVQRVVNSVWGGEFGLGPNGRLYLFDSSPWGAEITLIESDGSEKSVQFSEGDTYDLHMDGSSVWVPVWGYWNGESVLKYYKVFDGDRPLSSAEQVASVKNGMPAGNKTYILRLSGVSAYTDGVGSGYGMFAETLSDDAPSSACALGPPDGMPINEVRAVGTDAAGNFYGMARIWAEGWSGTESWYFCGMSADGDFMGSVMLPLDFYAGGGWTVTPSGKILEVRTTEDGVGVIEYRLKK